MIKRVRTIPTILGILLLLAGVGASVVIVQYRAIFKVQANPNSAPQDVRITNVSESSFTVSWITDANTSGVVEWGTDTNLGRSANGENNNQLSQVHFVTIKNLQQNTTYYFKINSGGVSYDNEKTPWQVRTATSLGGQSQSLPIISGSIQNSTGSPLNEGVVYVTGNNFAPLSAKISANGSWFISLANARTLDNSAYAKIENNSLLQIFVQGGKAGVATAQIYAGSANPTPAITLGKTHDFLSEETVDPSGLPESTFDIPEGTLEILSKIQLEDEEVVNDTNTVDLKSIDDGEVINTTSPEFFGSGPPGTNITIKVESEDPITAQAKVSSTGTWKWSPPRDLAEGAHTITISWLDASGILRQLTRDFVVSAQEGPSFETTPSGSTSTPTPQATATPASATPKSSPTIKPSASPTVEATPRMNLPSTDSGTPVAGTLTPTLVISIMGIALLVFAVFVSFKATQN